MKKMSKILAVLLTLTMLIGTTGYVSAFSDVNSENNFYESIQILSGLGIINGYEDGSFGPERDVTRAEFATMLMRAMASAGIGSPDPAGTPFTDLNDAAWAIGDVRTAYDLGIINGMTATTFEPNSKVTYEQALKMIVCALNYGGQADAVLQAAVAANPATKWYYGYVQTAKTLGITDNVVVLQEQPAKRAQIAQMIYNSLDVNMLEKVDLASGESMYMESKQNWLKDKLKITKAQGELLADESNSISADGATARPGYALFQDATNNTNISILKNGISLNGLLGKYVEYYYRTDFDGVKTLVLIYSKSGSYDSIKIDALNIDRITGSYSEGYNVSYYESATAVRTKNLKVAPNPVISFNGEIKTDVHVSELNIESGSLEFISTGGDYSKINVESYETYVVKSVNKTDKYIVDMFRPSGSNTLYLDDEDGGYVINIKNSSGSSISVTNIAQYNVLTVKQGKGASNRISVDVTVSNKNISGTIKEIDGDILDINGTSYEVSSYLNKYGSSSLDTFKVGDSCKVYLDKDGKIAYITKTASNSSFFGYISAASVSRDDVVKLAIVSQKTPSMGSPYISVASKVKIDGKLYSNTDEILDMLEGSAKVDNTNIDENGNAFSQLVKYTINANGEITEIDTAYISENEDAADETIVKAFEVKRQDGNLMTYKSSSYDFIGATNSDKFRINSSTQVFLVPLERDDFDSYGRKSSSFFKNGKQYLVEPYNVTGGLNVAEAVVVYETEVTEAIVEYNTPLFIISNISQKSNADGNPSDFVKGYQITSSGTVSEKEYYTADTNVIAGEYSVGDALIFVTDNKGYIKEDTIIVALDTDNFEAGKKTISTGSTTHQTTLYRGLLIGADMDGTTQIFDLALTNNVEECASADTYPGRASTSVKFFVYDPDAKGSEKIAQQDSFDLSSLASYNVTKDTETPQAAKLFVYSYYGSIRAIIVVK